MTIAAPLTDSVPFLLVRPSDDDVSDVLDEEAEAKSVPPRTPPSRIASTETTLPSVIVDLRELEASAAIEAARSSDVDVLLAEIDAHSVVHERRRQPTLPTIERQRSSHRSVLIAFVTAFLIAGTTFAGLSAVLHLTR